MIHSGRPRVLIADDHTFVAQAAKSVLEPEFDVVGIVGDGRELLEVAPGLEPDAVVIDIAMPLLNGLEAGLRLKGMLKHVKLLYLTMNMDLEVAAEAFRRGASGYLPKTATVSELPVALREILKGKTYVSPLITQDKAGFLLQMRTSPPMGGELTHRQREILQLLAEGKTMKEAASFLGLTRRTVAFHKYRMMKILGLKNNAEMVQYAVRNHLLFPRS
jgi:DNA-binding NarL/FixJ family response regulator